MHVRIYCPASDRMFGCVDIGPLELLAEREAEAQQTMVAISSGLSPDVEADEEPVLERSAADVWNEVAAKRQSAPFGATAATTS